MAIASASPAAMALKCALSSSTGPANAVPVSSAAREAVTSAFRMSSSDTFASVTIDLEAGLPERRRMICRGRVRTYAASHAHAFTGLAPLKPDDEGRTRRGSTASLVGRDCRDYVTPCCVVGPTRWGEGLLKRSRT